MRAVTEIRLRRAEGPSEECNGWQGFSGFETANAQLRKWAYTAPELGGYDKCDFVVSYGDDDTYEGRFDLQRQHTSGDRLLQEQMESVVLSYWGLQERDRDGELVNL